MVPEGASGVRGRARSRTRWRSTAKISTGAARPRKCTRPSASTTRSLLGRTARRRSPEARSVRPTSLQYSWSRAATFIRSNWPKTDILLRGDSHCCTPETIDFCRANGLDFVFGVAPTATLRAHIRRRCSRLRRKTTRFDASRSHANKLEVNGRCHVVKRRTRETRISHIFS